MPPNPKSSFPRNRDRLFTDGKNVFVEYRLSTARYVGDDIGRMGMPIPGRNSRVFADSVKPMVGNLKTVGKTSFLELDDRTGQCGVGKTRNPITGQTHQLAGAATGTAQSKPHGDAIVKGTAPESVGQYRPARRVGEKVDASAGKICRGQAV